MSKKLSDSFDELIINSLSESLSEEKNESEHKPAYKGEHPSGEKSYESSIQFEGKQFKLKVDINKNPTKKGLKIQFIPPINSGESDKQVDYLTSLQKTLNNALRQQGLEVDVDPDVPDKNIIGFTIRLDWFDSMIRNIFKNEKPTPQNSNS